LPGENNVMQFSLQSMCTAHILNVFFFFSLGLVVSPSKVFISLVGEELALLMIIKTLCTIVSLQTCQWLGCVGLGVRTENRAVFLFFVFFCSCYVLIKFSRGSESVPQYFYPICFSWTWIFIYICKL
jgi:hypothetical protein